MDQVPILIPHKLRPTLHSTQAPSSERSLPQRKDPSPSGIFRHQKIRVGTSTKWSANPILGWQRTKTIGD